MNKQDALVEAIRQISSQYKIEVPGKRRAWPKSLRARVMELVELGMDRKSVSRETDIPYFTVLKWSKERPENLSGEFREIELGRSLEKSIATETAAAVTVTTAFPRQMENFSNTVATVTVTTARGLRIEGLGGAGLQLLLRKKLL